MSPFGGRLLDQHLARKIGTLATNSEGKLIATAPALEARRGTNNVQRMRFVWSACRTRSR